LPYSIDGEGCESAFAKCFFVSDYETVDASTCFNTFGFDRWGWVNAIDMALPSSFEIQCNLYAGAAQCDTSKGADVGVATVTPEGFGIQMVPGWSLDQVHFYHGDNMFPTDGVSGTIAPGQYSNTTYDPKLNYWRLDDFQDMDNCMKPGQYFILHASVCTALSPVSSAIYQIGSPVEAPVVKSPSISPPSSPVASPVSPPVTTIEASSLAEKVISSPVVSPASMPVMPPVTASTAPICETAFAKCTSTNVKPMCFDRGFEKWGWTNNITSSTVTKITCDLYAGAAQCDTTGLTPVGTAEVTSKGFHILMRSPWQLKEVNFYHGATEYKTELSPNKKKVRTVDPETFESFDPVLGAWSFQSALLANEYFILHAGVCTTGSSPAAPPQALPTALPTLLAAPKDELVTKCEPVFAKCQRSTCFIDDGYDRWGWLNRVPNPAGASAIFEFDCELWSGYEDTCDTTTKSNVGTASFSESMFEINLKPGYYSEVVAFYYDKNEYPVIGRGSTKMQTVAPEYYAQNNEKYDPLVGAWTLSRPFKRGDYFILHTSVCSVATLQRNIGTRELSHSQHDHLDEPMMHEEEVQFATTQSSWFASLYQSAKRKLSNDGA
jgi:hypothetical protein